MQSPRTPRGTVPGVDLCPCLAVGTVPDVGLVVPLVGVSTDQPHPVSVDHVATGVTSFPIGIAVEGVVQVRVLLDQDPVLPVGRAPDFVVADHGKLLLVSRIPATNQEHLFLEGQRAGSVAASVGGLVCDTPPLVVIDGLGGHDLKGTRVRNRDLRRRVADPQPDFFGPRAGDLPPQHTAARVQVDSRDLDPGRAAVGRIAGGKSLCVPGLLRIPSHQVIAVDRPGLTTPGRKQNWGCGKRVVHRQRSQRRHRHQAGHVQAVPVPSRHETSRSRGMRFCVWLLRIAAGWPHNRPVPCCGESRAEAHSRVQCC